MGITFTVDDLPDLLALSHALGECPPHVAIIAIEPADLSPGLTLSPVLNDRFSEYLRAAEEMIEYLS